MGAIEDAMSELSESERARVLRWAHDKYGDSKAPMVTPAVRRAAGGEKDGRTPPAEVDRTESIGDFYTRASPTTEHERALVVAYWVQEIRGDGEFDSQSVNKELKHLGHGVSNITRAFDVLKNQKPQLVIQTQKSGKSKQARKLYKVTEAGKKEIARMLAGEASE